MAHKIMGERFLSRVQPAWHGLGEVFAEDVQITASEAVAKVAGDIQVVDVPLYYKDVANEAEDSLTQLDGHKAILRLPTGDAKEIVCLGVTTDKWHRVTYQELARSLDELSKAYKLETAGIILDGATCFLAFRGPDFDIKGDRMQDYFLVNLSQQPGSAHLVMATPVRTVCWNTNQAAIDSASMNLSIPHSASAGDRIRLAADLVARMKEITANNRELFDRFASTPITHENLDVLLEAAWPTPSKPMELRMLEQASSGNVDSLRDIIGGDRFDRIIQSQERYGKQLDRVNALREAGHERFEAFDPAHLRGTVWAGYNAVTEVADWRQGRNADVGTVWGGRAREKSRAFGAALELVRGGGN